MALVECPNCTGSVSNQAKTCPHCAHPLTHPLRTLGRTVFGVVMAVWIWSVLAGSPLGSPVSVGQDAVVLAGGSVPLVNDRETLARISGAQHGGAALTGLDLISTYKAFPITAGTRVHVLELGNAGVLLSTFKAARVEVIAPDAAMVALGALQGLDTLSPLTGWTAAQWLQPTP